jgi:hypothetical protein
LCNQAKNDLSQEEFVELCRRVVRMHENRQATMKSPTQQEGEKNG